MAKIEKLLEQATDHLEAGEEVIAAVQGTYETKKMGNDWTRAGILIATQKRIVFYAKKMGGYDLESFPYDKVSSYEQSKSMMGHSVTFFASGNKVAMKWISDQAALQVFSDLVRDKIHGGSATLDITSTNIHDDVMRQIRKLAELHQAGILTDEEFTSKKAELLSRL
ncbi:PH domain-containing protein [Cellulomonas sp. DKR-3]|uniref:PH domain-containing protein n=1 Tax=Cellulomonas fulva TaxID=2835530 RepID=A0ABS5U2B5_9CELL|nr:PH domain-containing protein [Cellulomonas fulva]MBT0995535.1 PH domain-containing protein [Cellulomonas fulva]